VFHATISPQDNLESNREQWLTKCRQFHLVSQIRGYPIFFTIMVSYGVNFDNIFVFRMELNSQSTDAENLVYFESLKRCAYLSLLNGQMGYILLPSIN
jgi:hypothetical protein